MYTVRTLTSYSNTDLPVTRLFLFWAFIVAIVLVFVRITHLTRHRVSVKVDTDLLEAQVLSLVYVKEFLASCCSRVGQYRQILTKLCQLLFQQLHRHPC